MQKKENKKFNDEIKEFEQFIAERQKDEE